MVFFSSISFGPYWVSRFCASAWVRPSGDDPSFFSTSARGSVFRSSFASGFEPGFDFGSLGLARLARVARSDGFVPSFAMLAAGCVSCGICAAHALSIAAVYSPRRAARLQPAR